MTPSTNPSLPQHIALIPDGNRRWAKQRGESAQAGHRAGYDTLKRIASAAFKRGVPYLTVYAFSTENWSRTKEEVGFLMKLMGWVVKEEAKGFHADNIRIRVQGSRDRLDAGLAKGLDHVQKLTRNNTGGTVNICFNYGGRTDLVEGIRKIVSQGVAAEDITEQTVADSLSSAGMPDPDLVIRTSGERRLSNYLIWETAYSELYFSDLLWPDFDEVELDRALADYAQRKRNFGK